MSHSELKSYWVELQDGTLIEISQSYFLILRNRKNLYWYEGDHGDDGGRFAQMFEDERPTELPQNSIYQRITYEVDGLKWFYK